jgi:GNAT superfamily N-acetyltransferase
MEFRIATGADTGGIAQLIHQKWDTPGQEQRIAAVIEDQHAPVWVAADDTGIAGFCSGFMTISADGIPRWEIDLLAVAPAARGKGLGRSLVARSVQSGNQHGAALQRALIAVDNAASARCFEVNGFQPAALCDLWVGSQAAQSTQLPCPDGAHLIPVDTLTYRGIWVEDRYDDAAFAAAQQMALADGRDTVGAVIPNGIRHDAEHLGFAHINTYRWWILRV